MTRDTWSGAGEPAPPAPTGVDTIQLRDGSTPTVRPIVPGDAASLVALHARLSDDTIYRRYFGARPHLAPAVVERFTNVAEDWRFALVAVREPDELVAVARYEGAPGERSAEIAVIVDDALQHQGLGRALLLRLVDVAVVRGLDVLVAEVLAANTAMLGLLRGLGVPWSAAAEGGTLVFTLDLRELRLDPERAARARGHVAAAATSSDRPQPGRAGAAARPTRRSDAD